jgi:replicative superfamily II helicase
MRIEEAVKQDALHQLAQQQKYKLEGCILSKKEDFMIATGTYKTMNEP